MESLCQKVFGDKSEEAMNIIQKCNKLVDKRDALDNDINVFIAKHGMTDDLIEYDIDPWKSLEAYMNKYGLQGPQFDFEYAALKYRNKVLNDDSATINKGRAIRSLINAILNKQL